MFDQVFWTDASQEEVFNQVCKPQVRTEAAGGILIKLPPPGLTLSFSTKRGVSAARRGSALH